jgi:hypothetical protein
MTLNNIVSSRSFACSVLIPIALFCSSQVGIAQFVQQGPKLVGRGAVGSPYQG